MMMPEARYILSLDSIRAQSKIVGEAARLGKLNHFDLHNEQLNEVVDYVDSIMKVVSSTAYADIHLYRE